MYRVCLILMFNLISAVPDINLIIRNKEEAICVGTGDEVEKFGLALVTPFLNDTIKYDSFNAINRELTDDYKEKKIKSFKKNIPPVLDKRWKYLETGSGNRIFFPFNKTNISVLHFSVRFKDTLTVVLHFEDISYCAFIYESENVSQTFTKNCPSITKQTEIQDFHQWKHYTIYQKDDVFIIQPSHFSLRKVEVFSPSPSKIELISTNSMQYKIHTYDVLKIKKDNALAVFNNITIFNHNCISIFLSIQSNCEIIFSLDDLDGDKNIIYQTFSTNEAYTWKEIKMFFNQGINSSDVALLIDNSKKCNAVLDQNIYKCSDKYFEKVTINKEMQNDAQVACQQFQNNNLVIYSQPNTNVVTSSVDSFGLYTNITCNNIFNTEHCDKSLICSQNECYCSPGFKGNYCQEECPDGSWGSSCKNVCTNCMKNNCNKYSGICSKCQAGFYGDRCITPLQVKNLESFLQNENSIGIRFRKPFFEYNEYNKINYCKKNICSYIMTIPDNCNLWNNYNDYKCVNIYGLEKNIDYNITVQGVYDHLSKFGIGTTIFVKTKEIASSPPLNANFKIFENNTVQLRWEYPERPNGVIRNFNVRTEIIETKSKEYTDNQTSVYTFTHEKNISDIKINRFYELNINDLKDSTMYHIFIYAESTIIGEENEKLEISTYPKKAKLENEPTVKCNITHCQLFIEEIEDLLNENKICIYKIKNGENVNFKELEAKKKCLFIGRIDEKKRNLNSETFFKINKSISDEYELGIVVMNDFGNKRSYLNKKIIIDTTDITGNAYLHSLWLLLLIPIIVTVLFLWKTDRLSKFCRKRKQEIPEYMELPTINKLDLNNIKMNFGNSIKVILKDDIISKLEEEFENITITRNFSCDIGNEAENKLKNRNNEIIPYDETLVKLKGIPGLEYINANYVKTPFGNKTIIATQCPQLNTFYDFWRMIWQENVSIIICLATSSEGKDNFFQYWPTNLEEMIMKGITIEHKNNEIYTGYVVKNFEIKINEELEKTVFKAASRNIKLFTFLSWPNDDIPINPLSYYYFLRHVEKCDKGSQPIVVHCSDGYGRTGTFIMTYNLIIKNDQESIDISELLSSLRTCRPNLITQANQYRFVYYITDEFINGINKTLNLTQLFIKVNKLNDTELESDLNYVNNRLYINKLLYSYKINNLISPDDCTNVVYVNGYEKENHFMSAQHPTISTIESFWTMVFTKEIQLVISLHEMKNENNLWAFDTEMKTFDSLEMELINKDDKTSFIIYNIKLIDPRNKNSTTCKLIKFKDWKFNQIAPRNYQAFRELYNLYINEASALMDNSPVLLTCVDGYTGCGLFIAVDLVLKKIKYTKEFNINWAVQSIQISREEFMTKKEQFKFIYEFSVYYNNLESRENLCITPTYLVPLKKL